MLGMALLALGFRRSQAIGGFLRTLQSLRLNLTQSELLLSKLTEYKATQKGVVPIVVAAELNSQEGLKGVAYARPS